MNTQDDGPRHPLCGGQWRGPVAVDDELFEVCTSCGTERHVERIGGMRTLDGAQPDEGFTHGQRTESDNVSF